MGEKPELSQYPKDCTLEACRCTTISPRSRFICLSMNILQRPRDVGQALWKHKLRSHAIFIMFPDRSRCWGLHTGVHLSRMRERRHLCLRDSGEVPSTFLRLSLVLCFPSVIHSSSSFSLPSWTRASLLNGCFSRSLPAPHLSWRHCGRHTTGHA